MSQLETLRDWCAYNARGRRGYLEAFAKLAKEELQHRGELNALLWQFDAEPPPSAGSRYPSVANGERTPRRQGC